MFWFGEVTPELNYVDGRVAYTTEDLFLHLAIFDRRLWYDKTPAQSDLDPWDAVSVYLDRRIIYRTQEWGQSGGNDQPNSFGEGVPGGGDSGVGGG